MPILADYPKTQTQPARKSKLIAVTLWLERPGAQNVYLCGDFNQWSPLSIKMLPRPGNGRWEHRLHLPPGRYEYKFVVDGQWIHNPGAGDNVPNHYGTLNSVLEVRS